MSEPEDPWRCYVCVANYQRLVSLPPWAPFSTPATVTHLFLAGRELHITAISHDLAERTTRLYAWPDLTVSDSIAWCTSHGFTRQLHDDTNAKDGGCAGIAGCNAETCDADSSTYAACEPAASVSNR